MSPPAEDIKKAPLIWEMLRSMPPEERTSIINRRFRTFDVLHLGYPAISQKGAKYIDQKRKEKAEMAWGEHDVRETDNVTWSVEEVQEMYPLIEREKKSLIRKKTSKYQGQLGMGGDLENDCEDKMEKYNDCEDKIEKYKTMEAFQAADERSYGEMVDIVVGQSSTFFESELERLKKSKLYDSLRKLFDTHSKSLSKLPPIEKIVAFGGGTLNPAQRDAGAGSPYGAQRTQHATLLVARDMLWKYSEKAKGVAMKDGIEILIQDPEYLDIDERIANLNGMEVLKCDTEKHTQAGWAKIDESTFFFDLGTTFPLHQLLFEITRPAAIFSPDKIVEDSFLPNIAFPATIMLDDGKEINIAGVGCSDYTFEIFTEDYECYKMDLEGLELGSCSTEELGWEFNDGHSGGTHIGRQPTLYIRRPHVVNKSRAKY